MADECLWSSNCPVGTNWALDDKLKPTNSLFKYSRQMRFSTADQHYLTCLILWSVPPTKQRDKSLIRCQNCAYFHLSSLCRQWIWIIHWQIYLFTLFPWNRPLRAIPIWLLTDCPGMAVTGRSVGGEISNMLDISQRSSSCRAIPVTWRWSASCPINMPYPQGWRR